MNSNDSICLGDAGEIGVVKIYSHSGEDLVIADVNDLDPGFAVLVYWRRINKSKLYMLAPMPIDRDEGEP